jgi:ubiquinone/menaquinone biosynthesis C-methylase UbiE
MNFSLVPPQRDRAELLDLHCGSRTEVRRSLRDIARINNFLGGTKISCDAIFAMLKKSKTREASVLDIGTGIGDIPFHLQKRAVRRGLKLQTFALDLNARHLEIAREELPAKSGVLLLRGDAFRLPFADASVDVVHSSLLLHHFRAPEIRVLLREFSRVAKVGWVLNDLERHGLPLWFFRTTWPIFAPSYITRLDGVASIRRAYTLSEMRNVLREFDGAKVERKFPFRLCVQWTRT